MAAWHYKVLSLGSKDYKEVEQLLNDEASAGWEVFTVTPSSGGDRVILRRRQCRTN